MNELNKVVEKIYNKFKPISIFLYGSMATKTNIVKSDYEIGVIFENNNYVSRSEIKKYINNIQYSVFPFKKQELLNNTIDTPFQKIIYINSLIKSAKTLKGESIVENMEKPKITTLDLLLDTRFNLGYALASVQNYKNNNVELANELFYKSCLYATRNLIYFITGNLEITYDDIFKHSQKIDINDEYRIVITTAFDLRKCKCNSINENLYYKNISYINKYIESKLLNDFNNDKKDNSI